MQQGRDFVSMCRLQQQLYDYNLYVSTLSYTTCTRSREWLHVGTFGAKDVRPHINREQGFLKWLVGCTRAAVLRAGERAGGGRRAEDT